MTPTTYTLKIVFNGTEEMNMSGLTYEQVLARAESASRSYGIDTPCHMKDGRVFTSGDDYISILSNNGLCAIEEIFSWGVTPDELEILKRNGIKAVEKNRQQARQQSLILTNFRK